MDIKLQKGGLDIEIKAKNSKHQKIKNILEHKGAKCLGTYKMKDVYFNVRKGRLKARLGDIKDVLIQYNREDKKIKRSDFLVSEIDKKSNIINSLTNSLGVKVIVKKTREIYILRNTRFHLDDVNGLGKFIEIEARGEKENEIRKLREQIDYFIKLFDIKRGDLVSCSYSDLLIKKNNLSGN